MEAEAAIHSLPFGICGAPGLTGSTAPEPERHAEPPAAGDTDAAAGGTDVAVVTGAMTGALETVSRNQTNELIERAAPPRPASPRRPPLVVADEFAALVADFTG
ncbi:hypothetical protein [Streptomyces sviceus]|uniref:hypothetical protein n=1 Tax=Streptomyces sviceus TaxID=285530 RepID=UPI0036C35F19